MNKFLSAIALALIFIVPRASATDYGIPDDIQDGNILHCFNWTFNDIKKELPNIAKAGFGAIQVSPVQGNCLSNAEWFYAYMPYDFKFKTNGNGSREQLKSLCQEAANYNIKIVVDVVANHINQAKDYHDSWWDSNGRIRWNGSVKYNDRNSIIHDQVGEYGDVNSEDAQVQARAKEFLKDLKSLGVKGIRWDAAKHIGLPSENCNFWKEMASVVGLWNYGEILDGPGGDKYKLLKEYTSYIGVTDTEYSKWTLEQIVNGSVPTGHGSWTANGVPANKIIYWGESHDDYSNDGQYGKNTSAISQDKIDRAYAIVACRNNETALYFSRPSKTRRSEIKMGQKGSTHFTSKEIAEVNKFRNAMTGTEDYFTQSNGVVCITRKNGGAVIVIGAGGSRNVSVTNGGSYVPAGTYKDQISGNTFTVTSSTISGMVGSTGIAVVYNPNGVIVDPDPTPDPEPDPTPGDGYYVYFNNTYNWDVKVWAWNDHENCSANTSWPGDPMTVKDGKLYWKAPEGKVPTMIIFSNNGGEKAGGCDLVFVNGATYNPNGTHTGGKPDPDPTPDYPETVYLVGDVNGESWNISSPLLMNKNDGIYTLDNVKFENTVTNVCTFSFITTTGSDWDSEVNLSDRYGAATDMTKYTVGNNANVTLFKAGVNASAAGSWAVAPGIYNVTLDLARMTMKLNNASDGIVTVKAENAKTIYYNLQGVRVEQPKNGLFIKVTDNKVEKIMVR